MWVFFFNPLKLCLYYPPTESCMAATSAAWLQFKAASVNKAAQAGRCNGGDVVDVRCRLQIKGVMTTNEPVLLQM